MRLIPQGRCSGSTVRYIYMGSADDGLATGDLRSFSLCGNEPYYSPLVMMGG